MYLESSDDLQLVLRGGACEDDLLLGKSAIPADRGQKRGEKYTSTVQRDKVSLHFTSQKSLIKDEHDQKSAGSPDGLHRSHARSSMLASATHSGLQHTKREKKNSSDQTDAIHFARISMVKGKKHAAAVQGRQK